MTYNERTTDPQAYTAHPDGRAPTVDQPVYPTVAVPAVASDPVDDGYLDDEEEWVSAAPKGLRVRIPTGLLLLLLFAAIGLWTGSILQKHHDKSRTTTAAAASGAAARRAAAAGATTGGATGGATGATGRAGATVGIVTDIQGSTVYLTDSSGNLVKIITTSSSTVNKTDTGTLADLKPGQTVIVTGPKGADGSTTARSITISPAGGGFGGGLGGAAGASGAGATGATGAPPSNAGGGGAPGAGGD